MKPKLLIVTGNAMKYKELSHKLSDFFDCEQVVYDEPEIQGKPIDILKHKLKRAHDVFKQPVLVDDVSVSMSALNGFPGPYMKDFFTYITPYDFGIKFAETDMSGTCLLGFTDGEKEIIAEGSMEGTIVVPKEEHKNGKQFDICFKINGMDRVLEDCTIEEKNKLSHRGKAMENLLIALRDSK